MTLLSNVTANTNYVRYGTVGDTAAPNNQGTNPLGGPYTTQQRYEMTAFLVSQYPGFSTTINSGAVANAVQHSIWAITNNSTLGGGYSVMN